MRLLFAAFAAAAVLSGATTPGAPDPRLSSTGRLAQERIAALGHRGLATLGSNCFNMPDCDSEGIGESYTQSETSIAIDTTGQHIVVGYNDFRGLFAAPGEPISVSGFRYSDNGGATFSDGGRLPVGPTTVIFGQVFPQVFGDPDVKYLGACNFVYSSLMLKATGPFSVVQTLSVHRSSDCGHTWSAPVEVTPASNPNGHVDVNGNPLDAADKELGDVDPDTNRYMVCWSNFTPVAAGGVEISCTYSDNIMGAMPVFSARRVVASAIPDGQGSAVRFAGNGSPNVYVAWARFPRALGGYANNIGFARSTDNGNTWSSPVNLTGDFLTMDQVLGNDRVNTNPSVAVDKSPGPYKGYVYVVYSNNNLLDGADVLLQRSTNGGISFTAPVRLNAHPGDDRAQWFPYVTVDRTTGRAWVFYYDQSIASSGDLTQVTYLYSDDGGSTWSAPVPLSGRAFKAGWGNDTSQPNLGDYNQAVAQFGNLYAVYGATMPVGFAEGQPALQLPTPDVFYMKIEGDVVRIPLRPGTAPISFTDTNRNGNIDAGEQIRLTVPLQNYVTNPLNARALHGMSGVLSTSTPGVIVTQASSNYPDLAPGASAANNTAFVLQVAPGFVAGTPIELILTVTSAQGRIRLALTLPTGTFPSTLLLSENFDEVSPGSLPAGWVAAHGGGDNVVPWTTTRSFAPAACGDSNRAFHVDAIDGPPHGNPTRWERLISPAFKVPANAQIVTLDFDVCYDTEDDPLLRVQAYDGFFLRVTDLTPGRSLRSLLAEAFERNFTTDAFQHYPKHFPRNADPNYFEDMSAWAGFSNGIKHVHMELPGMAGSVAQLRFEYTQDELGTCADLRPGHACGVSIDNVVVRSHGPR